MNQKPSSLKLHQLDVLRGLCALVVVFYHVEFSHPGRELSLFRNGSLFVDFFFVLSGFIMLHSHPRMEDGAALGRYMGLRFFRVYPLHLVMLLVFLAYETLQFALVYARGVPTATPPFSTNNGYALLLNLTLLNGMGLHPLSFNVPAWSISAEFWTYLTFGGVLTALSGHRRQLGAAFLALSVAALLLLSMGTAPSLTGDSDLFFVRCLYGFFLGAALRVVVVPRAGGDPASSRIGALAQLATLLLSGLLVCLPAEGERGLELVVPWAFALLIASFVHWPKTFVIRGLSLRPLLWLGAVSYSVYMVHMIVLLVVQAFARLVLHAPVVDGVIATSPGLGTALLLVYLVGTLIAAALTYRFIEEPGRKFGRALLGARRSPPSLDTIPVTER